ncbi:hypothetical protein N7541_000930 [Penicillium brevicompactum]|uniref:Uncharacterized protein n=1 Tax=Penicillium brevicompactum TaxID=5074 RepID=A0A9W9RX83_PENBR|nr:hypothetical protein N7541_000930 [Penicillium brevicompactum]
MLRHRLETRFDGRSALAASSQHEDDDRTEPNAMSEHWQMPDPRSNMVRKGETRTEDKSGGPTRGKWSQQMAEMGR